MLHRRSAHALLVLGVAAVFPAVSAAQSRTFRNKAPAPAQPATVPSSLPAVPQTIPALRPLPEGRARVIPPIPNLSNRPGSSRSPSLSAHDKTVAVAWEELTEGAGDILVAISSDGGRTYGAPTNVSRSATASSSPEVVVTPSHVAVLWVERTASGPKPYAAVRAGGDPFGAPKILDAAAVDPRSLSLAGGAGYVGGLWLDTDGAAGVLKYADVLAGTVASVASDRALASPTLLRTADGTGAVTPTAIFARSGGLASARPSSPGARWTVLPLPSLGVPRGPLLARGEGRATAIGQQIDGPAFHALGTTQGLGAFASSAFQPASGTVPATELAGDVAIGPQGLAMVSATNQAGRRGLTFLNPTTRETHAYAGTVLDARVATNASFQFVFAAVTDASQIVHLVAGKFHGDGSDFYDLVPTEIAATTNPQRLRVAGTSVGAAYAWQMGPAGQEEIVAFSDTSSP